MPALHEIFRNELPRLTAHNCRETSPGSWQYNCIAWAVGVTDAWWWPIPGRYWPPSLPREESLAAFVALFATFGYMPSVTSLLETGIEKVALYAVNNIPTHAARQLPSVFRPSKKRTAPSLRF
jgi:hypothetical protein